MSFFRVCPLCGAALDPGERCDCEEEKKAAVSASNADSGKAGYGTTHPDSHQHDTRKRGRMQE